MAKRKPNKRIQNKQKKQETTKKLTSHGIPEKKQKRMLPQERKKAVQKIKKAERAKVLQEEKKDFLKNHGISNYIINGKKKSIDALSKLSWDDLQKIASEKKKAERSRKNSIYYENTKRNKRDYARKAGLPSHLIQKAQGKTYKEIDSMALDFLGDRTVYKSKEYLSIMWSDVTGESNMSFTLDENKDLSTQEMIEAIHDIYESALDADVDDSNNFYGVAQIVWGSDSDIDEERKDLWLRGYRDRVADDSEFLVKSNEFTLRGFANLMLSVMRRTKPEFIVSYYEKMETFASEYLPEIHAQIFE